MCIPTRDSANWQSEVVLAIKTMLISCLISSGDWISNNSLTSDISPPHQGGFRTHRRGSHMWRNSKADQCKIDNEDYPPADTSGAHYIPPRVPSWFSSGTLIGWHVSTSSNSGRTAIPSWFELRLKKHQFCDFPGELSFHWGGGDGSRNGCFE